jgi:hypothetical protein
MPQGAVVLKAELQPGATVTASPAEVDPSNSACTVLVGGLQSSKGERTMKAKGGDLLLM